MTFFTLYSSIYIFAKFEIERHLYIIDCNRQTAPLNCGGKHIWRCRCQSVPFSMLDFYFLEVLWNLAQNTEYLH